MSATVQDQFPAHGAIAAVTDNAKAVKRVEQASHATALKARAAAAPKKHRELRDEAAREKRAAKKLVPERDEHLADERALREQVGELPAAQTPHRFDWVELLTSGLLVAVLDTAILRLTLTKVPGSEFDRWLLAGGTAILLALVGGLLGWGLAKMWPGMKKPRVVAAGLLVGYVALGVVTIVVLGDFRAAELAELSQRGGDFRVANPGFLTVLQLLAVATTAAATFKYFLGDEARRWLRDAAEHARKADAVQARIDSHKNEAERLRKAAEEALRDGESADLELLSQNEVNAAALDALDKHGTFVHHLFNFTYLQKKYNSSEEPEMSNTEFGWQLDLLLVRALAMLAAAGLVLAGAAAVLGQGVLSFAALAAAVIFAAFALRADLQRREAPQEQEHVAQLVGPLRLAGGNGNVADSTEGPKS